MAQGFIPSASFALSGAFPYLEYGWVCAPNAAGQSLSANTIETLTLDTEVQDLGGHGSISANQVTLAAGTYYAKATQQYKATTNVPNLLFRLFNVTDSLVTISESGFRSTETGYYSGQLGLEGQFTIGSSKTFRLEAACTYSWTGGIAGLAAFTLATAGAQQRTTLKLWKLA